MHIQIPYRLTALALLVTVLTACSANPVLGIPHTANPQATTQTANTDTPGSTTAPANDLCANSLVPVKRDATWAYINTGAAGAPIGFITTITDVRPDGFTVATRFDDGTPLTQEWACKPEGFVALSLGSAQTAFGLTFDGITASLLTSDATGITLPANVQPGMKWPYSLNITGNIAQGNMSAKVTGTVATSFEADGTETVTVPAGTFSANKILATSTFNMVAEYYGLNIPINSSVKSTFWFAPGVGWIKSVQTGDLPGTSINSTTVLQSYSIP